MREDIRERIAQIENGDCPDGYKHTKIGMLPNDWEVSKLSPYLVEAKQLSNDIERYPLYSSSRKGLLKQSEYYNNREAVETNLGYKIVPKGFVTYRHMSDDDIFYFNVNNTGTEILVSSEYPVFTTKNMNLSYLVEHLNNMPRFRYFCRAQKLGGTRTRLYYKVLKGYKIPSPPRAEQDKIAEILNQCDQVIELKQQLIDEERNRKKWLMQNLLDPDSGVRLPGFDGEWTKSTMGELFEFGSSLSASRADLGKTGTCYLHYGDIHGNDTGVVDVNADYTAIPKIDSYTSKVKMLKHGDVVFVDASEDYEGASKHVIVINPENIPFLPGLHTIPARSRSNVLDIDYKKYCFQSYTFRKQVAFYVSGMKVFGLNKENLAKIDLTYPSIEEQRTIAKLLLLSDKVIINMEQELAQWQQKKKALMQLLLTGIVRVSV